MESPEVSSNTVRFGLFEANLTAGELRKRGQKVPLQDQPFQILVLLLRRRGEIVARGELQQALWPADTFVEFEHGVNTAINKLRQALGDSADNPRFIETVPRRGYRFIAPVETETPAVPPPVAAPPPAPTVSTSFPKRKAWRIPGLAAIGAMVLITGLWPPPQITARVTPLTHDGREKGESLVLSGSRVFYTAPELAISDKSYLWSVPMTGGTSRREPTPCPADRLGTAIKDVSYTHLRILLVCFIDQSNVDLWLAGFDGDNPKWIGSYNSDSQDVSISPDLKTLLFSRKEGLYMKPMDGGAERLLARIDWGEVYSDTFWHPSGAKIGFFRALDGVYKAWEVGTDGTGMRLLLPEFAGEEVTAQWSPDGRRLYFISKGEVYMREARSWLGWMRRPSPVRLTSGPIQFSSPSEDPANPLVIYAWGATPQATAMKLNRKTNAWEPFLSGIAADAVNYSQDGQWITYISFPNAELWKCRKDGSDKVLLEDKLFTMNPRWSPDGTRIAFAARERGPAGDNQPFRIYTISANGGKPESVPGVPGPAFDPTWSPDGKRLVYAPLPGQVANAQQHVSIVNLETGAVQTVPGSDGICYPRWSPDGNWLAAAECGKIWPVAYNFTTQKWSELRQGMRSHSHWSKDSRFLYGGEKWQGKGNRLIRIEVATKKEEEIRKITEFITTGVISFVPFWTPDEEPIALKDLTSYQIYRIDRDR